MIFQRVPSAFVPDEDEGYFIAIVQAPPGASLEYTTNIAKPAEAVILKQPEVQAAFSVAGFSFSGASSNQGLLFARLKDYKERRSPDQSLSAVLNRVRGPLLGGITGAIVFPAAPPAIQGLSTFGGFQFEVLDESGGDISNLANATTQVIGRGNQSGRVTSLNTSFTANDPQLVVEIDHDKARSLACRFGKSPMRCRFCWARPTSTTSTSPTAPIACAGRRAIPSTAEQPPSGTTRGRPTVRW